MTNGVSDECYRQHSLASSFLLNVRNRQEAAWSTTSITCAARATKKKNHACAIGEYIIKPRISSVLLVLVERADGADNTIFDVLGQYDIRHGHVGRVEVRRFHQLAYLSIKPHNLIQDTSVHVDVVVHQVEGGAVSPGRWSHFDDTVLDQRAALVEACAPRDLRVECVAECGKEIVDCKVMSRRRISRCFNRRFCTSCGLPSFVR